MTELPKLPSFDINEAGSTPSGKSSKEAARPMKEIYADFEEISRMMKEIRLRIDRDTTEAGEENAETDNDK